MKESRESKLLRLWKIRQEAEGHDVSGVTTLKEAEEFFNKPQMSAHFDAAQLEGWSYNDLKKLASEMGLSAKGSKEELIQRICQEEVLVDEDATEPDNVPTEPEEVE